MSKKSDHMQSRVKLLAKQMQDVFRDQPWYGDSATQKLALLDANRATAVIPALNRSVSQIVAHMTAYQRFTLARLQGDKTFTVPLNSTVDWPALEEVSDWESVYTGFTTSWKEIHAIVEHADDSLLDRPVPGSNYDFQYLLDGIVQHTAYHLGQIGLLLRLVDIHDLAESS